MKVERRRRFRRTEDGISVIFAEVDKAGADCKSEVGVKEVK
jgi:hypothetical protein